MRGIDNFNKADESTVGEGVYLTSDKESAKGYATRRSKIREGAEPIVYDVEVRNLKMADLRSDSGLDKFVELLELELELELERIGTPTSGRGIFRKQALLRTLYLIRQHDYGGLKDVVWNHQKLATEMLLRMGFDGIVVMEGGEGEEVGNHDTYLVFEPKRVSIKNSERVS